MRVELPFEPFAGLLGRAALLATLFRETDRVQRSKQPLSLVLFAIDDSEHWTARLAKPQWSKVLRTIVERIGGSLRSYDTFGQTGAQEFLLILPGCSILNATLLAERLRGEAFTTPIVAENDSLLLTACFGIATSEGRSPIVVLREAEVALQRAQEGGLESIETFTNSLLGEIEPIEFLS